MIKQDSSSQIRMASKAFLTISVVALLALVCVGASYLLVYIEAKSQPPQDCSNHFRAAVYEHVRIDTFNNTIGQNLDVFEKVAREASLEGADVLVFPEDAIFMPPPRRSLAKRFMEQIPVVNGSSEPIVPCLGDEFDDRPILKRLSCAARSGGLYIVADMGDIQPCKPNVTLSGAKSLPCPDDGMFLYNTQVAFDRNGTLIAKYHKKNLFGEYQYNVPNLELVTFDTDFGRMGLFICFDLIFQDPGIDLVYDLKVDSLLFSTLWFDQQPSLLSHQYQQSWAMANNVNLLGANCKRIQDGTTGSGIYSGSQGAVVYEHSIKPAVSKLMIATIPISARSADRSKCDANVKVIPFTHRNDTGPYNDYNLLGLDQFENVRLNSSQDTLELCSKGLCCNLSYKLSAGMPVNSLNDYYLLARNGSHQGKWGWCEEMCLLVAYDTTDNTYSHTEAATFEYIELKANFTTKYVYPSVLTNDYKLVDTKFWQYDVSDDLIGSLNVTGGNQTVLNTGLYGRCYQRDPPYTR